MRAPSDIAPRDKCRFSAGQRFEILLRQSTDGLAFCDECAVHIATLTPNGAWEKIRAHQFDHGLPRGLYGKTTVTNGRAVCVECHTVKTSDDVAMIAKADRQGGRSGQQARRAARKGRGEKPILRSKGFEAPR